MIRERYGIDTGLIRDRYVVDTRTIFPDTQQGKLIRNLTFFIIILVYYILHSFVPLRPASRAKVAGVQIAIVEQLYKDNLPFSRMQVD